MEEEVKKDEVQEEAEVKEAEKETKEEKAKKEKPLDKMTVIELKEIATKIPGVTGATAMKKDELLKVIKEARGIEDEEPAKERKKKAVKEGLSVKELKLKIVRLKEEKGAARGENDKNKVDVLRRRINRLKKQTRKAAQT